MPSFRQAGLASLAAVVALSLASAASGETSGDAPPATRPQTVPRAPHKPAHTKRKKHRRTITTLTPRSGSRLTLAASADIAAREGASALSPARSRAWEGSLIDDSQLP